MDEILPVSANHAVSWRETGWRYQMDVKGNDMRALVVVVAVLFSASAFAQDNPPMVGDKPLVQVKPRRSSAPANSQSIAVRLQACLDIEDGTKGRLDCFDAVFPPKPANPKKPPPVAKAVADCRFTKEQDERLACFNGFAESIPKLPKS